MALEMTGRNSYHVFSVLFVKKTGLASIFCMVFLCSAFGWFKRRRRHWLLLQEEGDARHSSRRARAVMGVSCEGRALPAFGSKSLILSFLPSARSGALPFTPCSSTLSLLLHGCPMEPCLAHVAM